MMATLVNNDERQESYILVVIQPDNLERMRKADPITLESVALGGILPTAKYPEKLGVLIAYEEDEVALYKAAQSGNFADMIRFVHRGYRFNRDEDGTQRAFSINRGREAEKK
jgi:hypothetical protein